MNNLFRRNTKTVAEINRDFREGKLFADTSYQRRKVWNDQDKVRLIETILMELIMPEVFFWTADRDSETGIALTHIVDGQQRITTIVEFIQGDIYLNEKYLMNDKIKETCGKKYFSELDDEYRDKLWDYPISIVQIDSGCTKEQIKEIFYRLNLTNYNLNQQEILYKGQIDLAKLNINSKVSNIIIKKYDGKDVIVERSGNKNLSTITTKESGSELTIDEEFNNNNSNLGKSIDDIVRYLVDELYTSHNSDITVYIPENIDINVNTNNGGLYIDGVNANNLNFNTQYGNISLSENSNIKTLNIKSNSDISLKVREVYCIDNLSIESNYVNIYEGTFVEDESKIPESIKILAQGGYDNSVNINTNLPIAKNLDITSEENVDLKLPISDYKFNFDIKTSNSISFDENSVSKYLGTSLENYINSNDTEHILNEKSFKGLINEELINNPTEYFVNIRSANVKFN